MADHRSDDVALESTQGSDAPRGEARRAPVAGDRIGRFRVSATIGAGGMGVVYLAHDDDLQRKVAIKLVRADVSDVRGAHERLTREAQALARLSHPGIVHVYEVGKHEDQLFIAMEHVDGPTLRAWLRDRERSRDEILEVFVAIGRALAAAHAAGITHRDFKPDNTLIGRDGRPRVLDFGLARTFDDPLASTAAGATASGSVDLTLTGALLGTPAYMAPEQLAGEPVDARADQFAFCVALYEALYGERPYRGATLAELANAVLNGEARPAPDGPAPLRAALARGLSRDRDARFPDMAALLSALVPPSRARRWPWIAAGLAAVAIGGAAFVLVDRGEDRRGATCEVGASRLTGVWDAETRAAVEQRFGASPRPDVRATWTSLSRILDDYAAAWRTQWDAACASADRTADPLLYAQRISCLEDSLLELRSVGQGLTTDDVVEFSLSYPGGYGLRPLVDCESVDVLRSQAAPPPPAVRDEVAAAMLELFDARNQGRLAINAGQRDRLAASIDQLDRVVDKFLALDQPRGAALALWWKGHYLTHQQRVEEGRVALDRARALAIESHDDERLAIILLKLAEFADGPDAAAALERADEAVLRAGRPWAAETFRLMLHAGVARTAGDRERSAELARQIVPRVEAHSSFAAATPHAVHVDLVEDLLALGRTDEALAEARRAADSQLRRVGSEHRLAAYSLRILANQLGRGGAFDEALVAIRRAIAIDSALVGASSALVEESVGLQLALASAAGDEALVDASFDTLAASWVAQGQPGNPVGRWLELSRSVNRSPTLYAAILARTAAMPGADRAAHLDEQVMMAFEAGDHALMDRTAREVLAATTAQPGGVVVSAWFAAIREPAGTAPFVRPPSGAEGPFHRNLLDGMVFGSRGEWARAVPVLEAAQAAIPPGARSDGQVEAWLGVARLETGDVRGAIATLEQSLQLTRACCFVGPYYQPMAELALGRALWDAGGDRARARALAAAARDHWAQQGSARAPDRAAAEAWLAAHAAP